MNWRFVLCLIANPGLAPILWSLSIGVAAGEEMFDWPDRRPINAVFLATSDRKWETNPRGYFNDPKIDIRTQEGRERLRQRLMELADSLIATAREVDAQGILVWDIEGGEMPHPITYLGDPRILPRVAPEMDAIADEFFRKFQDAGLMTGVCIRPTNIVFREEGEYPWISGRYGHTDTDDPVGVLSEKIAYARQRWGCRNFYIDTNYTPKLDANGMRVRKPSGHLEFRRLTGDEMAELRRRHPDVLIWPEFQDPDYFRHVSGYGEYHTIGDFSASARQINPRAFRVWMPRIRPEEIYSEWERFITKGVLAGEVFLYEAGDGPSPMAEVLKNAASEKRMRTATEPFQPDTSGGSEGMIRQYESEKEWAHRRALLEALGRRDDAAATTFLDKTMRTETNGLQWFAARALARQETPASLEALRTAAATPGEAQIPALRSLGSVRKKADVLPLLLQTARDENSHHAARWAALDAIGELGEASAVPSLLEAIEQFREGDRDLTRQKIIRALGAIGDPQVVPTLNSIRTRGNYRRQNELILSIVRKLEAGTGGGNSLPNRVKE